MNHSTNRESVVDLITALNDPNIVEEVKEIKNMSLEEDAKKRTLDFFFRRMGIAEQTDEAIAKIDRELLRRMDDPEEGLSTAQLLKYRADLALARNADTKVVLDPLKPAPNGGSLINPQNTHSDEGPTKAALGANQSEVLEKVVRGLMAATEKAAVQNAKRVNNEDGGADPV